MMIHSKSLGQHKFFSMIFVAAANMALEVLMLMVNTVLAGHAVGETGVSAMNIMTPVATLMDFSGTITATGVSICYAAAMGRADKKRADELFGMSLIVGVVSGVLLWLMMETGLDEYLSAQTLDAELSGQSAIMSYAREYYSIYRFVLMIEPTVIIWGCMVYYDGDEITSSIDSMTKIFGNLIMSIIFAFVFKMGMKGLALGTLLADVLSFATLSTHFFRKNNSLSPRMHFSFRDLWDFFRLGFADSGLYLVWGVMLVALNKFTVETFGSSFLPVVSMILSITELSMLFDGVAEAVIPIVSVYHGEGNYKPIRKIMASGTKVSLIEGAAFSVILLVFADYVPGIFGIDDPEILGACVNAVRITSTTLVFSALMFLFETYYMTFGKSLVVVVSLFTRNFALPAGFAVMLGSVLGIDGIAWGTALAQPVAFGLCAVLLCVMYGRKNFPLYLEEQDYIADYDVLLTQESVMHTRDEAEKFMTAHDMPHNITNKIMLLIEETGMLIIERNPEKQVLAEFTIELHEDESAKLTVRDNGEIFDMTDADTKVISWRSYFLSLLMSIINRKNLITTSFNRNILTVLVNKESA